MDLSNRPPVVVTAEQARVVAHALPFLRRYAGATVLIRFGGPAADSREAIRGFAQDVALLKQVGINPIVVHGGGSRVGAMHARLAAEARAQNAPKAAVDVAEMVLAGTVNKEIAGLITEAGALAMGICGKDAGLITARRLGKPTHELGSVVDLCSWGEPEGVDIRVINALTAAGVVPVIAPVAAGKDGRTFRLRADAVAGAIAGAAGAQRMLMLTDVPFLVDQDGEAIPELTVQQAHVHILSGTFDGPMTEKVRTCVAAVEHGVKGAVILDGRLPHACLLEMFLSGGIGTLITA